MSTKWCSCRSGPWELAELFGNGSFVPAPLATTGGRARSSCTASVCRASARTSDSPTVPAPMSCPTSIALELGAERVDYYDAAVQRLEVADRIGACAWRTEAWPERVERAAITVDCSQSHEGLACALRSTERGGFCTTTSVFFGPTIPFPAREMYFSAITFENRLVDARTVLPRVLALIEAGRLAPERVTTEMATWQEAGFAITEFSTKLVVTRGQ